MIGRLITLGLLVAGVFTSATGASLNPARAGAGVLAAPPKPESIGIRLVEAPLDLRDNPRAQRYIIDHLSPGDVISRRIEVSNSGTSTARVALYSAAATVDHGAFQLAAERTQNELSTWTGLSRSTLSLPPNGRSVVKVTIRVPDDASSGERYAVIWGETSSPAQGGGVTQVGRVGVRVYLSVGPGGPPPSDFTIDTLTAQRTTNGEPVILARVHNTGGRALDLTGSLEITDGPGGLKAGPFPVRLGTTLAPGEFGPVKVTLDQQIPDGPWLAHIHLQSGLTIRSAKATIRFPKGMGSAQPVEAEEDGPFHPLVIIGLALFACTLIVITGVLVVLRRRRRRRSQDSTSLDGWTPPEDLVGAGHRRAP